MTNIKINYVEDSNKPVCYTDFGSYAICLDADGDLYTRWFGDNESTFGVLHKTTILWGFPETLQGAAINKLLDDIALLATDILDRWSIQYSEYHNADIGVFSEEHIVDARIDKIGYLIQDYGLDDALNCDIWNWDEFFVNNESPNLIYNYMINQEGLDEYPDRPIYVLGNASSAAKQRLQEYIESVDVSSLDTATDTIEDILSCYERDGYTARFWGSFVPALLASSDQISRSDQGILYDGYLILPTPPGMDLIVRVSDALNDHAIPDLTGGFSARVANWDIAVPADGNLVTLANTAAGVYTTLPWEFAATVDLQGNSLVFRDSAGAITAEIKIDLDSGGC